MRLLELRGGYLHQHRADIVPQGYITDDELALWCAFFELRETEKKAR